MASKDKAFVLKMSIDPPKGGVDFIKHMHVKRNMSKNVKRLKDWTTLACHVYDSKYCKALTIACCNMQSQDGIAQTIVWRYLNHVLVESEVLNMNSKGLMAKNAQTNWIAVKKTR